MNKKERIDISKTFYLFAALCSIIGAIPTLKSLFIEFPLAIGFESDLYILGLFIIYFLVIFFASYSQGSFNFIPTTGSRFRFLFVFVTIIYAYFYKNIGSCVFELRFLLFLYLIYCLGLSQWVMNPNYGSGRQVRTIIDILFTSLFCYFCGDQYLLFYSSLFIPITVTSRHVKRTEMFVWVSGAAIFYLVSNILHVNIYQDVTHIRGVIISTQLELNKLSTYLSFYYFEILFIYFVAFIFWAERRREEFINNLVDEIYEMIGDKANVYNILKKLCNKLKIQLGVIVLVDGSSFQILTGYSLKKDWNLNPIRIIDFDAIKELKDVLNPTTTLNII